MSCVRLYFDVDAMQRAVVGAVRARGIDVTTALEVGMEDRSDQDQLVLASSQGRVLFSHNACDFCRIHTEWLPQSRSHAGIILATQQRYSVGERIRRLLKLIAACSAEEMRNRLEFLSDWV